MFNTCSSMHAVNSILITLNIFIFVCNYFVASSGAERAKRSVALLPMTGKTIPTAANGPNGLVQRTFYNHLADVGQTNWVTCRTTEQGSCHDALRSCELRRPPHRWMMSSSFSYIYIYIYSPTRGWPFCAGGRWREDRR